MMPNHIRAQRSVASRPHHRDRRLPAASEGENTVGTTHISTAETTVRVALSFQHGRRLWLAWLMQTDPQTFLFYGTR